MGLSRGTGRAHIARAALEAIALSTMEVVETMAADADIPVNELRVDGGAAVNNLLMQIQSDIIDTNVVRPKVTETTALGAAYLSGLATGFWENIDQLKEQWQVDRKFEPSDKKGNYKKVITNWKKAVERSKGWYDEH